VCFADRVGATRTPRKQFFFTRSPAWSSLLGAHRHQYGFKTAKARQLGARICESQVGERTWADALAKSWRQRRSAAPVVMDPWRLYRSPWPRRRTRDVTSLEPGGSNPAKSVLGCHRRVKWVPFARLRMTSGSAGRNAIRKSFRMVGMPLGLPIRLWALVTMQGSASEEKGQYPSGSKMAARGRRQRSARARKLVVAGNGTNRIKSSYHAATSR